jgi:hypothetical protein
LTLSLQEHICEKSLKDFKKASIFCYRRFFISFLNLGGLITMLSWKVISCFYGHQESLVALSNTSKSIKTTRLVHREEIGSQALFAEEEAF